VQRRDFLLAAGAVAALSFVPGVAQDAWNRVATTYPPAGGLSEAHLALVSAISDAIIPRTDTPGATDVGVPAWINVVVAGYYTDSQRAAFLDGLAAIDALAQGTAGAPFAAMSSDRRERVMSILDRPNAFERFVLRLENSHMAARIVSRSAIERMLAGLAQEARAYAWLKGLVVHGYFTSERVQKEVLRTVIIPGSFDGAAPMPLGYLRRGV